MILASALGAGGFVWLVFGSIAGIFPRHTAAMWRLWLAVAFTFVVVDVVAKPFMNRARPYESLPEIHVIDARPTNQSFPSGHAAMAFAGALAGTRMIPAAGWILWPLAGAGFRVARLPRRSLAERRHRRSRHGPRLRLVCAGWPVARPSAGLIQLRVS